MSCLAFKHNNNAAKHALDCLKKTLNHNCVPHHATHTITTPIIPSCATSPLLQAALQQQRLKLSSHCCHSCLQASYLLPLPVVLCLPALERCHSCTQVSNLLLLQKLLLLLKLLVLPLKLLVLLPQLLFLLL
jgi:hypothetical protein